jgi:Tfp pilus assembly protein PilE
MNARRAQRGLTLVEILTALVGLVVLAALVIVLGNTGALREQRKFAMEMLYTVQRAEDQHFADHARYADLEQLGIAREAAGFALGLKLGADGLGYLATVRPLDSPGNRADTRCAEMHIDQHGRRSATSAEGEDSSADCWSRQ